MMREGDAMLLLLLLTEVNAQRMMESKGRESREGDGISTQRESGFCDDDDDDDDDDDRCNLCMNAEQR
jgi:hypothetical protein